MPPKEPKNAVFEQEFHRYGIMYEERGRKLWEAKYGSDYCQKVSETHRVSDRTRAGFGQPSAVKTQEVEIFNAEKLLESFKKAVHYELDNDVIGVWGDAQIDQDLFPVDAHSRRRAVWD